MSNEDVELIAWIDEHIARIDEEIAETKRAIELIKEEQG
jgi:hemerythrin